MRLSANVSKITQDNNFDSKYENTNTVLDIGFRAIQDAMWNSIQITIPDTIHAAVRGSNQDAIWICILNTIWNVIQDAIRKVIQNNIRDAILYAIGDALQNTIWDVIKDAIQDVSLNVVRYAIWDVFCKAI